MCFNADVAEMFLKRAMLSVSGAPLDVGIVGISLGNTEEFR